MSNRQFPTTTVKAAESSLRPAAKGQHKPPTNNSRDVPASDYSPGGGPSGTDPNLNKLRRQATAAETNQLGSEEREEAVESIAGDRERLVVPPQSVKRVINNVENGARGKKSYGTVNFAAAGGTVERGLHLATPNFEQHVGEDEERENDKRTDKEESEESSVTAKKSEQQGEEKDSIGISSSKGNIMVIVFCALAFVANGGFLVYVFWVM